MNCKYCRANCTGAKHDREIALCLGYDPPKTNGDFIRSMSDEELAETWWKWIDCSECPARPDCSMLYKDCVKYALDWLKKECE